MTPHPTMIDLRLQRAVLQIRAEIIQRRIHAAIAHLHHPRRP